MRFLAFAFISSLFVASHVNAGELEPPIANSRGPVLCIWSITVTQIAVAEKCFKGQNRDYVDALKWSVGQMDTFIKRNSSTEQKELDARRDKLTSDVSGKIELDPKGACIPGQPLMVFYPKQPPPRAAIEAAINKLLEFNRRPEMHPCI